MKNLILIISLLFTVSAQAQVAGWFTNSDSSGTAEPATFYNQLMIGSNGTATRIKTGIADPSAVATLGEAGDLYLSTNGKTYVKQDSGSTTNWLSMLPPLFSDTVSGPSQSESISLPFEQITVTSGSPSNHLRFETGNDNFLANPSFEHEIYDTGWTTSGSATFALGADAWEGSKAVSVSATGGTQEFELFQTKTLTQYEGNTLGFTCMVKSDSAKVKLCTENGTTEKDCVYHDGSGAYRKMQAIMMVDSTGVMKGSIKSEDNINAEVKIDSCEWSNDPLKIKSGVKITEWTSYSPISLGFGTLPPASISLKYRRVGDTVHIIGKFDAGTVDANEAQLGLPIVEGVQLTVYTGIALNDPYIVGLSERFPASTPLIHLIGHQDDSYLNFSRESVTVTSAEAANAVFASGDAIYINAEIPVNEWSTGNGEILTASDIVSSEAMAFQFKTTALDCNTDPVGMYTTQFYASGSNFPNQCATAPTVEPNSIDGVLIYTKGYSAGASTCALPARVDICIGKGLRGEEIFGYQSANKGGDSLYLNVFNATANTITGLGKGYNASTGMLTMEAATDAGSSHSSRVFTRMNTNNFTVTSGYFHFHASKNPVVNAMETIPRVDYSWENEFSASVTQMGVVTEENENFLTSCTNAHPAVCTFVGSKFSQAPACKVDNSGDASVFCFAYGETTTGFNIKCYRDDGSNAANSYTKSVSCSRLGSDYRSRGETAAIIAQPTCYLRPHATDYSTGQSSSTAWKTIPVVALEGSCEGISISSNQVTVEAGTYKLVQPLGAWNDTSWVSGKIERQLPLPVADFKVYNFVSNNSIAHAALNTVPWGTIRDTLVFPVQTTFEFQSISQTNSNPNGERYQPIALTRIK